MHFGIQTSVFLNEFMHLFTYNYLIFPPWLHVKDCCGLIVCKSIHTVKSLVAKSSC